MKLKNIVALALVAAFACLYAGSSAGAAVLAMAGTVQMCIRDRIWPGILMMS